VNVRIEFVQISHELLFLAQPRASHASVRFRAEWLRRCEHPGWRWPVPPRVRAIRP
jgi:hypothetical protein